jgi:hypothetical protein
MVNRRRHLLQSHQFSEAGEFLIRSFLGELWKGFGREFRLKKYRSGVYLCTPHPLNLLGWSSSHNEALSTNTLYGLARRMHLTAIDQLWIADMSSIGGWL